MRHLLPCAVLSSRMNVNVFPRPGPKISPTMLATSVRAPSAAMAPISPLHTASVRPGRDVGDQGEEQERHSLLGNHGPLEGAGSRAPGSEPCASSKPDRRDRVLNDRARSPAGGGPSAPGRCMASSCSARDSPASNVSLLTWLGISSRSSHFCPCLRAEAVTGDSRCSLRTDGLPFQAAQMRTQTVFGSPENSHEDRRCAANLQDYGGEPPRAESRTILSRGAR